MHAETITLNGRPAVVELTETATRRLRQRGEPLFVELEFYLSCLVKKFVHFRQNSHGKPTIPANDQSLLQVRDDFLLFEKTVSLRYQYFKPLEG